MLKIDPEGTLKETNELRIKTVKTPDDSIEAALSEYSDVFQGIGCFRERVQARRLKNQRGKPRKMRSCSD